jgi:hypothetical protein
MNAMTRFTEWLGRVIMLVLAGMVTLSLIGAIASIPSGSIETRLGVEPGEWPEPSPSERIPAPPPRAEQPGSKPSPAAAPVAPRTEIVAVPQRKQPVDAARWLESITYALIALVGLAALGLVLLWRALHHLRRSADALEALALRPSA